MAVALITKEVIQEKISLVAQELLETMLLTKQCKVELEVKCLFNPLKHCKIYAAKVNNQLAAYKVQGQDKIAAFQVNANAQVALAKAEINTCMQTEISGLQHTTHVHLLDAWDEADTHALSSVTRSTKGLKPSTISDRT
jgi:hypothetical protein